MQGDPDARVIVEEGVTPNDPKAKFEQDMTPRFDPDLSCYIWDGHKRVAPSRQVLLSAHQASYGSGCPLSKVRLAQCANNATRDVAVVELYRKLTGDEITPAHHLLAEKEIVVKKRSSQKEIVSPAVKKWLEERPPCVGDLSEHKSKPGSWKPTATDGNHKSPYPPKPPPAPGSLAAGAAPSGKKSGAFASKVVSAGVPQLAKTPWSGFGGVLDVKDEKRNRTPHPMRYDTTILDMTSNTSWRNQACRPESDPMAEGSTWATGKREPVPPTRKAKGFYLFGGSGMHPSPTFMSTTPRESAVFKPAEMRGPLKPVHAELPASQQPNRPAQRRPLAASTASYTQLPTS